MKISFAFDNPTKEMIAEVIEQFYKKYEGFSVKEDGEEIEALKVGKVNIYLQTKGDTTGNNYSIGCNGCEIVWKVRLPLKDPTKHRKNEIIRCPSGVVICN